MSFLQYPAMCLRLLSPFPQCLLNRVHRHTKTQIIKCADRLLSNYIDIHCPHRELSPLPTWLCTVCHYIEMFIEKWS